MIAIPDMDVMSEGLPGCIVAGGLSCLILNQPSS